MISSNCNGVTTTCPHWGGVTAIRPKGWLDHGAVTRQLTPSASVFTWGDWIIASVIFFAYISGDVGY